QAHFVETVPTMPEYEPVARSKRAGEDALRALLPNLADKGISLVVVSGDMIEGTVTATLLDRSNPGAIEARRAEAGKLYSVEEFAAEVAKMVTADVETGPPEMWVGEDYCAKPPDNHLQFNCGRDTLPGRNCLTVHGKAKGSQDDL